MSLFIEVCRLYQSQINVYGRIKKTYPLIVIACGGRLVDELNCILCRKRYTHPAVNYGEYLHRFPCYCQARQSLGRSYMSKRFFVLIYTKSRERKRASKNGCTLS
uniref:Uncharacterized protein n=1 Tax=Trichogramma kaykai TaxID=54128 RepID=A0ABD2W0W3_9HYME